jgi:putative transposase
LRIFDSESAVGWLRLGMKVPADVYIHSPRLYRGLEELTYPFHDATLTVTQCGRICFRARKVHLSHVFA